MADFFFPVNSLIVCTYSYMCVEVSVWKAEDRQVWELSSSTLTLVSAAVLCTLGSADSLGVFCLPLHAENAATVGVPHF